MHESRQIRGGQTGVGKSERQLRISKLKWTGIGEFSQMTIISTTAGRNLSEEME